MAQQDKEITYREGQIILGQQPGKVDAMNYEAQQQQPQYHHG
jgi:hypothetical protein